MSISTSLRCVLIFCLSLLLSGLAYAQTANELLTTLWSPDGNMVATGSKDGRLQIWDKNGALLFSYTRPTALARFSWSPDSKRIAITAPEERVEILNIGLPGYKIGAKLGEFHQYGLNFVKWSPSGTYIATSEVSHGYDVQLWDATTYMLHSEHHFSAESALEWSHDGNYLASANEGRVIIVDMSNFSEQLVVETDNAYALSWSPDNRHLAVNLFNLENPSQSSVTIYDISATAIIPSRVLTGTAALRTSSMAWSPDGTRIASAVKSGDVYEVIVFSAVDGTILATYPTSKSYELGGISWNADSTKLVYPDMQNNPSLPSIVTPPIPQER